jgi:nucleoside-diphosphate-sugar epimerase
VIVNPGVIIGPGFWNSGSGKIFTKINQRMDYYFPKTTGFVGVWDVVKVMRELMNSPVKNEEFIVVSENMSFKDIFSLTAKRLGKPAPSKKLKKWMIFTGWLWQEISGLFTNKEKQLEMRSSRTLFEHTFYSSAKLKQQLDFEFEPIQEVIEKSATSFRKDLQK